MHWLGVEAQGQTENPIGRLPAALEHCNPLRSISTLVTAPALGWSRLKACCSHWCASAQAAERLRPPPMAVSSLAAWPQRTESRISAQTDMPSVPGKDGPPSHCTGSWMAGIDNHMHTKAGQERLQVHHTCRRRAGQDTCHHGMQWQLSYPKLHCQLVWSGRLAHQAPLVSLQQAAA